MDKALKQRLVGASVLVALAVLTLPMLLDGPNGSRQESRPIEIPPRPEEVDFQKRRFPIGEQSPDQPSTLPEGGAAGTAGATMPGTESIPEAETMQQRLERIAAENAAEQAEDETPLSAPIAADAGGEPESSSESSTAQIEPMLGDAGSVATPEPSETPLQVEPVVTDPTPVEPAEPSAPDSETATGRYLVQVASFSSTTNADRLAGNLRESGMPVVTDTVDSAAGVLNRVRVGPFEQRAEAEQVLARLARQMPDVRPRLVDLRPGDEAPVTRPEDPLVRWVVQVGVFSDEANAEKLVFQLRDSGFRAMSQTERTSERVVYRVLVGPEVSREAADRLRDRLEAEQGMKGIVQSTD